MTKTAVSAESTQTGERRRRQRFRGDMGDQIQGESGHPCVGIHVGRHLRELRVGRGLSIRSLAEQSGLNANTLSLIENSKTSPSVSTLQQLANALNVSITAFFEAEIPENTISYQKAGQRPSVSFAYGILEDLGFGMPRRGAETFLVTLNSLSNSGENFIVHTGRETVFCLEGQLTYTIEDQTFLLERGDSLFFEAHLPHRWQNTGTTPTRSLLVLCPSDGQDRPTDQHFTPETVRPEVK